MQHYFHDQQCFGIGIYIWNAQGHYVKALTKRFEYFPTPLEAEALGLREGITWLGELGLSMVQIEPDYKLVVEAIMDTSNNKYEFGNILANCRSLLLQHFLNL